MKKIENTPNEKAPVIILVRPQLAENMGMVARAMMNCTLTELRLVQPRESHLSDKALAAASGAQSILETAAVFETLEGALADIQYVLATTARHREMIKPVFSPEEAVPLLNNHLNHHQKTAILFGAERTGLENDEVIFADGIIEIPLNPQHSSLNLSQAVLLVGYIWFHATQKGDMKHTDAAQAQPATKAELAALFTHLENELTRRGYFRFSDKKERMQRNLRNIFTRAALTKAEIKTLHGVITDLIRPL